MNSEFTLKAVFAQFFTTYVHIAGGSFQDSILWHIVVAYVGSNHFLYGVHRLLGSSRQLSDTLGKPKQDLILTVAGMGALLENRAAAGWIWGFDEHRLADACVHLGMALSYPWRIDHWVELFSHLCRYSGFHIDLMHHHHDEMGLSICDCMDIVAHCVSACWVLGAVNFAASVAFAEAFRWMIFLKLKSNGDA